MSAVLFGTNAMCFWNHTSHRVHVDLLNLRTGVDRGNNVLFFRFFVASAAPAAPAEIKTATKITTATKIAVLITIFITRVFITAARKSSGTAAEVRIADGCQLRIAFIRSTGNQQRSSKMTSYRILRRNDPWILTCGPS